MSTIKDTINSIKTAYKDNFVVDNAVVSIAEITYKDDNGDKQKIIYYLV